MCNKSIFAACQRVASLLDYENDKFKLVNLVNRYQTQKNIKIEKSSDKYSFSFLFDI